MSVYTNLKSIRKLSNASLTSIIDVTNLNFKNLSDGSLEFLNNINYNEVENSISLYKGTLSILEVADTISMTLDGIPTLTINSLGKLEGQELLVKVSETKRHRFTDFPDWPDIGVPGEIIYTGIQNQRPEFGEDFIGYLDGRGWVSLTGGGLFETIQIVPQTGSPLILPTVDPGTSLIWIGPPGYENQYEPQSLTVYFSDEDGNVYDILTDHIWEKIGQTAKYKLTGDLIIGDSLNTANIRYIDGNQQAGYVLTSDAFGNATWQPSSGGGGPANSAYSETKNFTIDVPQTINHGLGTSDIHVQLIDLDTSEIIEGHFDNYTINTVDVTLSASNNNVRVVVLAAGGTSTCCGGIEIYSNFSSFPVTGSSDFLYIDSSTSEAYYWDGSSYVLVSSSSPIVNIYNSDGTLDGNRIVDVDNNTLKFDNAKIGINVDPTMPLEIRGTAIPSTNENLFRATVSDASGSYFVIQNGTTADGEFIPKVLGRQSSTSNSTAIAYSGIIDSTQDSGSSPVTIFQSHLNTLVPVVTRPIFQWNNWATKLMTMLANGNLGIGTTTPTEKLDVAGKTKTTTFQMTTAPSAGYVLTSDASGNGSWAAPTGITKSVVTFTPGPVTVANTIIHNLGTADIIVQLWDSTTGEVIVTNISNATSTTVDITFTTNPSGDVKAVIV